MHWFSVTHSTLQAILYYTHCNPIFLNTNLQMCKKKLNYKCVEGIKYTFVKAAKLQMWVSLLGNLNFCIVIGLYTVIILRYVVNGTP